MKPIIPRFKNIENIGNNLATQASTSSVISTLKKNKKSFYQTRSTNFSVEQIMKDQTINSNKKANVYKNIYNNYQTPPNKSPKKLLFRHKNNLKLGNKRPLISVTINPEKEKEKEKIKDNSVNNNSLIPTNINSFLHLISGKDYGIYENINWALGLRDYRDKEVKITESSNPPGFYSEDLDKFKKNKKNTFEPLVKELNPNYNKIRHLVLGKCNNKGNINLSQFKFSTCLRDYKTDENKKNKEREKNWKNSFLPSINTYKFKTKILSPITQHGIDTFSKLEKIVPKNYQVNYVDTIVGNDKIKAKSLINNKNYTICGFGDSLGDEKYDNDFGDVNISPNLKILSTATNPQCKFELGLRLYGTDKKKKYKYKINIKKKLK